MFINQVFELSMILDGDCFHKLLSKAQRKSDRIITDGEYCIDQILSHKGLTVKYRDSTYKKKITLIVNTALLLKEKVDNSEKLVRKTEKRIAEYFDNAYSINDFDFSNLALISDINVGSRTTARSYIKILKRIRRVKGFSPVRYDEIDKDSGFCLSGNSNGIDFRIYDFSRQLDKWRKSFDASDDEWKPLLKDATGVLRSEVVLTGKKTIKGCTDSGTTSEQMKELSEHGQEIFVTTLFRIIPPGDYCKMGDAVEIVRREVKDVRLRRRMLRLLALIPEKKSLLLAQKAMNYRRIDDVMDAFAKIDLSPVTIGKRSNVNKLDSLYSYLLRE